ncbi:NAD(P)-binding protein [Hypoxylon trugodes]|uniref:NAD(P)-binding protein n=1 Tax=Hypoxylon trugodes TaxID=326681 RepID=UPI002199E628|nr:NAD(P)-binding protein [Hypoxylon trugodes]KAI1385384.1 NAD(P)-binding protein [Hypoxylon trugodes]
MTTITKVALAGAKGNLGEVVLDQLLKAGFQVTALTRQGSSQTFPSNVSVKAVDYSSLDSLVNALRGQDAVVATIASAALGQQLLLIEAAAKAGVKHFIPSEFGCDTLHERTSTLPGYKTKVDVLEYLKKTAAETGLTWTAVFNGPFLDWGLKVGFLLNVKERTVEYPDGGNNKFSTTTLESIGKAVAGVLKNPEQTKNRGVYVQDAAVSQRQLAEAVKKVVGADGWKETITSTQEIYQQGLEEAKKANPNPGIVFVTTLKPAIWGEGWGSQFEKLDNDLFGIKQLSDEEFQAAVASYVPK